MDLFVEEVLEGQNEQNESKLILRVLLEDSEERKAFPDHFSGIVSGTNSIGITFQPHSIVGENFLIVIRDISVKGHATL